jgi:thiol-disulfide isomerase/thioredoxin
MSSNGSDKGTIILAFLAAGAFFLIFVSVMEVPEETTNENMVYGPLNTTQLTEVYNTTRLRVYYSELCPACAKEIPILVEVAKNGTVVEMIEVSQNPEETQKDSIEVTPTLFVINGPNYLRIDGFADLENITDAMEKVRDKSKLMEESYGS